MKIALVSHKFPPIIGGGESHVYFLAKELSTKGHDIRVLTGDVPELNNENSLKFKIVRHKNFQEYGSKWVGIKNVINDVFDSLYEFKPEVVHAHNHQPFLITSMIKEELDYKLVYTYHNTPVIEENKFIGIFNSIEKERILPKFLMKNQSYDALIANSQFYYDWALKLGAQKNKIHLVYHGVDKELFTPGKLTYEVSENPTILSPIRLIKRKGIIELLDAYSELPENIKLLIAGSKADITPDLENKLYSKVNKLENHNLEILLESFSIEKMPELYHKSDLVVLPSYIEGLGICLLEALSTGTPVVATNVSGINEVIKNNYNGLLVPPKDSKSLATAMTNTLRDEKLRKKFVKNGFNTISQKFELKNMINKIEDIYQKI